MPYRSEPENQISLVTNLYNSLGKTQIDAHNCLILGLNTLEWQARVILSYARDVAPSG